MTTSKEEIQSALGLNDPPDETFMALLEQVGDADIITGPLGQQESGLQVLRPGRITLEYTILDLADDLWRGDRKTWARIYAAALRDPAMRGTITRAAQFMDPDFSDLRLWWLAVVDKMPPVEPAIDDGDVSTPTSPL